MKNKLSALKGVAQGCAIFGAALAINLMGNPQKAIADDTELFTRPPGFIQPAPNVLFILDNSANWNASNQNWEGGGAQGLAELRAIANVMDAFADKPINVGLMMYTGSGSTVGSYVRYGFRPVENAQNRSAFRGIVNGMVNGGNLASQGEQVAQGADRYSGKSYYEAYLYFSGLKNFWTPDVFGDFSGNSNPKTTANLGLTNNFAYPSSSGGIYSSPLNTGVPCARNYIIFISNAGNNLGGAGAQTYSNGANPVTVGSKIPLPSSAASEFWIDEWAKYLYETGVKTPDDTVNGSVITYSIDVYNAAQNTTLTPLMQSMARNGGGRYFQAANEAAIENAISEIFDEIQSVNSVFASVSLPVSVNVRGTNLNQVYLGMFRPDLKAQPVWPGNLKQYQLAMDENENLFIADSTKADALSSTGFFKNGAISFWTSANTYWSFDPASDSTTPSSDSPDGPLVERGGAGQSLRWNINGSGCESVTDAADVNACKLLATNRKVYTHLGGVSSAVSLASNASNSFSSSNTAVTSSALGAASDEERTAIINWIRGADLKDEDGRGDTTDLRPMAHGDVVHSRPAVINYNRYGDDNDIMVYYGANDGLLRAIQGGQAKTPGNDRLAGGAEYWSFAAEEFYPKFKRQYNNSPKVSWEAGGVSSFTNNAISKANSNALLISPAVSGISTGLVVSAASGINTGTTVTGANNSTTLLLSNNSTSTGTSVALIATAGNLNGTLSAASNFISLTAIPSWLRSGMSVSGTGISTGTVIDSISASTNLTLTNNATSTNNNSTISFSLTGTPVATRGTGSSSIAFLGAATAPPGVVAGLTVSGNGVPAGSKITGLNNFGKLVFSSTPTVDGLLSGFSVNTSTSTFAFPPSANVTCASGSATCNINLKVGNSATYPNSANIGQIILQGGSKPALITAVGARSGSGANRIVPLTVKYCSSSVDACSGSFSSSVSYSSTSNVTLHQRSSIELLTSTSTSTAAVVSGNGIVAGQIIGNSTYSGTVSSYTAGGVPGFTMNNAASSNTSDVLAFSYVSTGITTNAGSPIAVLGNVSDAGVIASLSQGGLSNIIVSSTDFPAAVGLASAPGSMGVILNNPSTVSGLQNLTFSVLFTGNTFINNPYVQIVSGDVSALTSGMSVSGSGVPASTTITSNIGAATVVLLSTNATVSTTQLVTFTNTSAGGQPKPYFFDGPIGVWRYDAPNTGTGATATAGDGKIVAGSCNVSSSSDCDKVWIFVPFRRGGRSIYAFDVTEPKVPKLMWKIKGGTTLGFEELGQTWSLPQPVKMNISGTSKPVLVFGGGYDAAVEDQDPIPSTAVRSMGRAIYFVDAQTGAPIKVFKGAGTTAMGGASTGTMTGAQQTSATNLTCSVPADAAVLNKSQDTGFTIDAYRIYLPDTCGQVWRIDTSDSNPNNWLITRIASVGSAYYSSSAGGSLTGDALAKQSRKFLFSPDVVFGGTDAKGRRFDYVLLGSGDREHPFNGYGDVAHPVSLSVDNRFYMFKDYNIGSGYTARDSDSDGTSDKALLLPTAVNFDGGNQFSGGFAVPEVALYDATDNDIQLVTASTEEKEIAADALGEYHGWYIRLEGGEKVVGGATSAAGSVFFGTNLPTPTAAVCTANLGEARLYQINIKNAAAVPPDPNTLITNNSARYTLVPGGGLPPTPVAVAVIVDGKFVEGVIAGTQLEQPSQSVIGSRVRVFSRKLVDRK